MRAHDWARFHTFLFADLVGFTRFTAQHGDDRAADLAVSFHEHVCRLAAELGRKVVKTIGNAVPPVDLRASKTVLEQDRCSC